MLRKLQFFFGLTKMYWDLGAGVGDFFGLLYLRLSATALAGLLPHRLLSVELPALGGPVFLRSHTTDIAVISEIFLKREYDPLFRELTDPPQTVIDLGANTGLVSRLLLSKFPQATLLAVEPEPSNFEILQKNLAALGGRGRGSQVCVGGQEGRALLTSDSGEWAFRMTRGEGVGTDIPIKTFPQILTEAGFESVDLLKCDIEGAEEELFGDCGAWIGKVSWLLVECHPPYSGNLLSADLERIEIPFVCHDRSSQGAQEVLLFSLGDG